MLTLTLFAVAPLSALVPVVCGAVTMKPIIIEGVVCGIGSDYCVLWVEPGVWYGVKLNARIHAWVYAHPALRPRVRFVASPCKDKLEIGGLMPPSGWVRALAASEPRGLIEADFHDGYVEA